MQNLLLLTSPGLEDLVKGEIIRLFKNDAPELKTVKARSGKGWVEVSPPVPVVPEEIFRDVKTCCRGMVVAGSRSRGEEAPEKEAVALARKIGFRELAKRPAFRISCFPGKEASGTGRKVEQDVGAAAVELSGAPVSLKEYSINYGIEFIDNRIFFGTVYKDEEETPRYRKQFQVRSSVRAHIAAAMLNISGFAKQPGVLLDPCCGSGTILLEAAAENPGVRLYGVDVDPKCASGAQRNLQSQAKAGTGSRTYQGDARKLTELFPADSIHYLVTNPPFGIRTGKKINFYWFYRELLQGADRILTPEGRIAILIGRQRGIFNRAVEEDGRFKVIQLRVIEASGLFPALYILKRR